MVSDIRVSCRDMVTASEISLIGVVAICSERLVTKDFNEARIYERAENSVSCDEVMLISFFNRVDE